MNWALDLNRAIDAHDLADHAREIEETGATIVSKEKAGITNAQVERARSVLMDRARLKTGARWDVDTGPLDELDYPRQPGYFWMTRMLEVDPVFRDIQCNEVLNTLHRLVLGDDFRLCTSNGFLKWAHPKASWGKYHGMHVDTPLVAPAGFGYIANVNWLLTDYTADDGPICYIPGSHKRGIAPGGPLNTAGQPVTDDDLRNVRPVEGPAGSLFIFHSSIWHGSLPRKKPGLRLSMHAQRSIPAIAPLQYFGDVDDAWIDASPDPNALKMLCWKTERRFLQSGEVGGIPRLAGQRP